MKERLLKLLEDALLRVGVENTGNVQIERSRKPEHGHFSSNIALTLPKILRKPPLEIAHRIVSEIRQEPDFLEKIEIAPPGFINFSVNPDYLRRFVPRILMEKEQFGKNEKEAGKIAQVEFVSANPTGPLTVGHGRQAVLGDTIARILEWNGFKVIREYYFNNAGRQMRMLALSCYARYCQILGIPKELPEGGYEGEYIREIAGEIVRKYGESLKDDPDNPLFQEYSEKWVFQLIRETLERIHIKFDEYFNEKSLYEDGSIEKVLQELREKDCIYDKEGAIWFRAGDYGGTGDKVLWKSVVDEATYRLPDIAYHRNKLERGFNFIVDVFGSDHQATYPDVLAGLRALGYDVSPIRVVIHQFVTLTQGGEKVKMSTRKATFVTLDELIEEVGADVVRFFFLTRTANSHLNFDLDLAKKQSEDNPVFYLQYAYARICSIIARARSLNLNMDGADYSMLREPETMKLLNLISEFPEVVLLSRETLEPHHIVNYLHRLATAFHRFYTEHRVITDDAKITTTRLHLIKAVRIVIRNGLSILGVSAPERM